MKNGLSINKQFTLLGKYMDQWIDAYPNKIKPFDNWIGQYVEKQKNEGKKNVIKDKRSKCRYCRRPFNETVEKTKDHVMPLSKFGLNVKENRVPCCYECNQWKRDKTLDNWLKVLKNIVNTNRIKAPYDKSTIGLMMGNVKQEINRQKQIKNKTQIYKNL